MRGGAGDNLSTPPKHSTGKGMAGPGGDDSEAQQVCAFAALSAQVFSPDPPPESILSPSLSRPSTNPLPSSPFLTLSIVQYFLLYLSVPFSLVHCMRHVYHPARDRMLKASPQPSSSSSTTTTCNSLSQGWVRTMLQKVMINISMEINNVVIKYCTEEYSCRLTTQSIHPSIHPTIHRHIQSIHCFTRVLSITSKNR